MDTMQKEVNIFVTVLFYLELLQFFECVHTLLNEDSN